MRGFWETPKSLCVVLLAFCSLSVFFEVSFAANGGTVVTDNAELVFKLDQVIERARYANRYLLQNALLVQNSRYSLQSAESEFDWKISLVANLGLSKSDNSTAQATGVSGEISKKSSFGVKTTFSPSVAYVSEDGTSSGVGVSLSIPLFRGFGKEYNYDSIYAADYALQSSIRNVYLAEVEKILETVSLAYEVIRQQTLVAIYSEQDARLQHHVVTIELKEKTGLGSQIDTYRAQIRQKDVQNQLAVARQQFQRSLNRLKVLLALPIDTQLQLDISFSYDPTQIEKQEAQEIALANRMEIEQTEADLVETRRKSQIAEKRILPDLNFVASYRKNTFLEGLDATQSYYGDYWSVGLTSDTDIARSSEKASFQQSLLSVRRMQLHQENQRDLIRTEVNNRLDALGKEAQSIRLRKEQSVQAMGKRRLAAIKFSHGMGGNFDFIEADTELQQAKANLLGAKINYIVGQYRLRASLGTLITR